jgi:hypothetical protein
MTEPSSVEPARVRSRLRPALFHLLGSTLVAGLGTFALVRLWYPPPFASLAGGLELLVMIVAIDVLLGPVLTLVVASPGKLVRVLARDLAVILAVQLAALGYGLYTVAIARPIGLVFEVDQMRVVSAAEIDPVLLAEAPPALRTLPWTGPRTFAAVKPTDPKELLAAIQLGAGGVELSMLPRQWRDYASQRGAVLQRSRPVALLLQHHPGARAEVEAIAARAGVGVDALRFLPLRSRKAEKWVTLVPAPDARIVGHLPLDGDF